MQRVEVGQQLISTNRTSSGHQPGLDDENRNDFVVCRGRSSPGRVVVESKVTSKPDEARSVLVVVHAVATECKTPNRRRFGVMLVKRIAR